MYQTSVILIAECVCLMYTPNKRLSAEIDIIIILSVDNCATVGGACVDVCLSGGGDCLSGALFAGLCPSPGRCCIPEGWSSVFVCIVQSFLTNSTYATSQ